uniref:Uncharacterized protein n=1 Tax=Ignisphaera aggregans TaxID=334771 RepID=A0A7J3QEL2_9CREN
MVLTANEEYIPILIVKPSYEYDVHQNLRDIGLEPITIGTTLIHRDVTWLGKVYRRLFGTT